MSHSMELIDSASASVLDRQQEDDEEELTADEVPDWRYIKDQTSIEIILCTNKLTLLVFVAI